MEADTARARARPHKHPPSPAAAAVQPPATAAASPSPATAALPAATAAAQIPAIAAAQPPAAAAAQPPSPTAVQCAAAAAAAAKPLESADVILPSAAIAAQPAGATHAPVPVSARAVAATRSVAATRNATAAATTGATAAPTRGVKAAASGSATAAAVRRAVAATALPLPAPRALAMITRSSGGASLNTDLSLYQTAMQSRLHLLSHGYVSCKADGNCGFNAASQLQYRSSHPSCSIDDLTGVGQGQQQDMRQLATDMLRTNISLQKALCHPEVETDVFNIWKDLVPARQARPDAPVWLLLADLVQKSAQSSKESCTLTAAHVQFKIAMLLGKRIYANGEQSQALCNSSAALTLHT